MQPPSYPSLYQEFGVYGSFIYQPFDFALFHLMQSNLGSYAPLWEGQYSGSPTRSASCGRVWQLDEIEFYQSFE